MLENQEHVRCQDVLMTTNRSRYGMELSTHTIEAQNIINDYQMTYTTLQNFICDTGFELTINVP